MKHRLSTLFILAAWALIFIGAAHATSPTKPPVPDPAASAESEAVAESAVSAPVTVDSGGASIGFLLGGNGSGSDSTSVCLERRPSWGFGFRGDKTKLNAQCWNEYMRQAEHQRELDLARLELERLRLEIERDRAATERLQAEQCFECGQQK